MTSITASVARERLYRLLDELGKCHDHVVITGRRNNCVLLSEDDWRSIQKTLHLLSVPGMRESIRAGLAAPIEECAEELDW